MNHRNSIPRVVPLASIFLLLSLGGPALPASASPAIGIIQKVIGTAAVIRSGHTISADVGLEVWENDTLRTGPDGAVGVVFRDDTLLSMGPESVLVIDQFVSTPRQGWLAIVLRMLKGNAICLSGLISKLTSESAHFETPTASIGNKRDEVRR